MVYLNLDKLLKMKKKSRYWLVQQIDMSYANLNKLIRSEVKAIRFETIDKLCYALDCEISDLLKFKKD